MTFINCSINQFFKQILSSVIGTIAALLLIVTIGASGLIVFFLLLSQDGSPTVKDKTVLVFDLATKIQDTEPTITLSQAFSQEEQATCGMWVMGKHLLKRYYSKSSAVDSFPEDLLL